MPDYLAPDYLAPDYLLYHFPGSCSQVAMNALEETGVAYRDQGVALFRCEHHGPAFVAINPKRKVPVLRSNGRTLTELPLILYHLANAHPEARLLPADRHGAATLDSLADLVWLAGSLHPLASRMFRPGGISEVDPEGVKASAQALLALHATEFSARLGEGWWYGGEWAITDVFVAWLYGVAEQCEFPLMDYPALAEHRRRVEHRPSFTRTRERESEAVKRDGLSTLPAP